MLARKWLFLRACGHLLNARDRGNAKHLRGALIPENPEECSHSSGYISNSIHNIYSYYLYYFYYSYLCIFLFLLLLYLFVFSILLPSRLLVFLFLSSLCLFALYFIVTVFIIFSISITTLFIRSIPIIPQ